MPHDVLQTGAVILLQERLDLALFCGAEDRLVERQEDLNSNHKHRRTHRDGGQGGEEIRVLQRLQRGGLQPPSNVLPHHLAQGMSPRTTPKTEQILRRFVDLCPLGEPRGAPCLQTKSRETHDYPLTMSSSILFRWWKPQLLRGRLSGVQGLFRPCLFGGSAHQSNPAATNIRLPESRTLNEWSLSVI